jgi:hypothetical protein
MNKNILTSQKPRMTFSQVALRPEHTSSWSMGYDCANIGGGRGG